MSAGLVPHTCPGCGQSSQMLPELRFRPCRRCTAIELWPRIPPSVQREFLEQVAAGRFVHAMGKLWQADLAERPEIPVLHELIDLAGSGEIIAT
ncbi:hypothetical protein [Longispora albida]|uniref:hypothetical protein n=1 Tax=Longispora albida TaxID=203523 RepID=UPI0003770DD3|nr:hypothetical protein [Longispora albida]